MNYKFALITSISSLILFFFALKISYAQELINDRGKYHPLKMKQTSGLSPRIDSAYLFFAMPKYAIPTQLKFSCQYREEPGHLIISFH